MSQSSISTSKYNGVACQFLQLFRWYDVEDPHGWQHLALLEAWDIIREKKRGNREVEGEEVEALKRDVLILRERSAVLRNVLVASSIGFSVVIASIMVMSKY
ncbi:hypothetical protein F2Q68_00027129 [Brassica cretica]|uniref:Uncharacterized protein n=1 Tax=Brassica cretica TaxID=69181 RepID=A0A8S9IFW9_BRACR|nr:hypothetical protein F2Q68_00027129 [Brassica cretica]